MNTQEKPIATATEFMNEITSTLSDEAVNDPQHRDGLMRAIEIIEATANHMRISYNDY